MLFTLEKYVWRWLGLYRISGYWILSGRMSPNTVYPDPVDGKQDILIKLSENLLSSQISGNQHFK